MIRYALRCPDGHVFDSWFKSASAFEALVAAGHVTCGVCGSADISKALMSPRVVAQGDASKAPVLQDAKDVAIAQMRKQVEENATYVGGAFAEKARAMHEGTAPETSIYGEASGAKRVR